MTSPDLSLHGSDDYRLVALSVLISMIGAYAALELSGRVTAARDTARLFWLLGGAVATGIGTWSMHYTAMLAFTLPVPVLYNWPLVLLSLLPGIIGSAVALFVVSLQRMRSLGAWAGGIFMAGGVAAMHYTAMAAMRMRATAHYSPPLVLLSVVLPIGVSFAALWMAFLVRGGNRSRPKLWKAATILVWGAVNPVMHYIGMAAATFVPSAVVPSLYHAVSILNVGVVSISIVPLTALAVAVLVSLADQLQGQRALLDALFEQGPHAVALSDADDRVGRVNREFTRLFGYSSEEAVGRRVRELIVPEELWDEAQAHADLMAHGQPVAAEVIRRQKDGTRLNVSVLAVPVAVPGRQAVGKLAVYSFADITGRKRAEQQLQNSFAQLRALAARLQNVREEERARLAREIHDELGQALTSIKLDLAYLMRDLRADQERESSRVESALKVIDQTIQSVRRIATELRPAVLDALGLVDAIEWAAQEFEARTGTKCRLQLPAHKIVIDQEAATALFRILQETLTNVARHAAATEVHVRLVQENGTLSMEVHDNGKGITEKQLSASGSLGILGMQERALLLGGKLTIHGEPGQGTTVRVQIPQSHSTPEEHRK